MITSTPQLYRDLDHNEERLIELYTISAHRRLTDHEWAEADELYQRSQMIRAELAQRSRYGATA